MKIKLFEIWIVALVASFALFGVRADDLDVPAGETNTLSAGSYTYDNVNVGGSLTVGEGTTVSLLNAAASIRVLPCGGRGVFSWQDSIADSCAKVVQKNSQKLSLRIVTRGIIP